MLNDPQCDFRQLEHLPGLGQDHRRAGQQRPAAPARDAAAGVCGPHLRRPCLSGSVQDRPGLTSALECARSGDSLIVWRLDRLGRSLRHLIDVVHELEQRGVALVSLTEQIDTSTPGGRLVFHVFASLAQFEKELIRERTMAGLAAARARGRVGGRPTVWTVDKLRTARSMRASGDYDVTAIAKVLAVSRASVYRALELPLLEDSTELTG